MHALQCSSHYYIIFSQNSSSGHIQSGSEQKWKASLWAETLPAFTHSHKLFSASCTVLSAFWCVRLFACYWEDGIMTTNDIIIFELHSFWPLHHKNGIRYLQCNDSTLLIWSHNEVQSVWSAHWHFFFSCLPCHEQNDCLGWLRVPISYGITFTRINKWLIK